MKLRAGFAHILILAVFVVAVAAGAFFYFNTEKASSNEESIGSKVQKIVSAPKDSPAPTPFPFQELTIPYLRERTYESSLAELRQYSNNDSYTSYLTSYDSEGFSVNGLLTIPNGEEPEGGWPAVVFIHGYIPPTLYKTTERYNDYVNYLARNGLVVFKIDLRGHGESEGEAFGAYNDGQYIIDALNAKAALENADFVDPEKIGLWGHSMAGNVTFRSFVASNNEIPAIVIWAGAVYTYEDLQQFRIDDNSYRPPTDDTERRRRRQELTDTYGSFNPESEFWQKVVPTNYLDGTTGAVQIHHALDDTVVNIGYSRNLMEVLEGSQIEHELFEYTSGGHNFTGSSFTQAMQKTVEFYQRELE
jgi:dipeptidyl aminopeptidase/acylaminoacyl peptidase